MPIAFVLTASTFYVGQGQMICFFSLQVFRLRGLILEEIYLKSLIHTCPWLGWQDLGSWASSWCCLSPDAVMKWEFGGSFESVNIFLHRQGMWIMKGQRMDFGRLKIATNFLLPLERESVWPPPLKLGGLHDLLWSTEYGRSDVRLIVKPASP